MNCLTPRATGYCKAFQVSLVQMCIFFFFSDQVTQTCVQGCEPLVWHNTDFPFKKQEKERKAPVIHTDTGDCHTVMWLSMTTLEKGKQLLFWNVFGLIEFSLIVTFMEGWLCTLHIVLITIGNILLKVKVLAEEVIWLERQCLHTKTYLEITRTQ